MLCNWELAVVYIIAYNAMILYFLSFISLYRIIFGDVGPLAELASVSEGSKQQNLISEFS